MQPLHDSSNKNEQLCCPFSLAQCSGMNYILQCSTAIGVAVLLALLGRFLPKLRAAGDSGLFS
jgi:hypothetical protein